MVQPAMQLRDTLSGLGKIDSTLEGHNTFIYESILKNIYMNTNIMNT